MEQIALADGLQRIAHKEWTASPTREERSVSRSGTRRRKLRQHSVYLPPTVLAHPRLSVPHNYAGRPSGAQSALARSQEPRDSRERHMIRGVPPPGVVELSSTG